MTAGISRWGRWHLLDEVGLTSPEGLQVMQARSASGSRPRPSFPDAGGQPVRRKKPAVLRYHEDHKTGVDTGVPGAGVKPLEGSR